MTVFFSRLIPKDIEDRLANIVTQTLNYRKNNNVVRNDFLHILSQLKKTCKEYEFTDVDVTAHASGFFIDGFETSASVMSFVLHELAANGEAQGKLREEIVSHFRDNDNKLSYEGLQGLPYLDAVIQGAFRYFSSIFEYFCFRNFENSFSTFQLGKGVYKILHVRSKKG